MNEKQVVLIDALQARIDDILQQMAIDPFYAPPGWTFENIWHALEALKHA
jgi:tryptophan-rich sensory protein